ncbi:MAG: TonB family protein [Methylocella sp.]
MTMAAILPADEEHALRRWVFAAATVAGVHGAIGFWLMHVRDASAAGAPPAVIMIELEPLEEVSPEPQMTKAEPEKVEQPQPIPAPELPPVPKPKVILTTPPKPKPKKIVKEVPKPEVKPVHQLPSPRTRTAPRAGEAAAWRSSWSAEMSWSRHYPEAARARGEQGTVRLALTIDRSGHVVSARVIASSGSSILDQAALEMARHASGRPLPPEMGPIASLTVPVRYSIR